MIKERTEGEGRYREIGRSYLPPFCIGIIRASFHRLDRLEPLRFMLTTMCTNVEAAPTLASRLPRGYSKRKMVKNGIGEDREGGSWERKFKAGISLPFVPKEGNLAMTSHRSVFANYPRDLCHSERRSILRGAQISKFYVPAGFQILK